MRFLLLIPILVALPGCGTKTPLIMSPAPVKASLLGWPTPPAQITPALFPQSARHDHSNVPQATQ